MKPKNKGLRVALVIPTHYNIKSSLHVLINAYKHLHETKNVDFSIFTDSRNSIEIKGVKIEKIRGIDYKTPVEKILFLLGIPRFYYLDLAEKLKDYDVIETSNPEFYLFAWQSYLAAKKYKKRLVLRTSQSVEGFFLFRLTKYFIIPIAKQAYSYASSLVFTNDDAAQRCIRLGLSSQQSKFIITGHGVDTKIFRPLAIKTPNEKFVLLSVAGLYKIKGHHLIIRALKKIIENGKDAELWIIGEGYYKKNLKRLAMELGIEERVIFKGSVSREELARIYNLADAFALANYQEITPAVSEAMACGLPVVVMDCGGRRSIIPDDSYGLISKKYDVADMSAKIMRIMDDKKMTKKMAENGRKRIIKLFSMEAYAQKLFKALK